MSAAAQRRTVSRASSGLGVGSPLGWLWTTINPVVPGVTHAGTKTSGIETVVLARVPRDRMCPCQEAVLGGQARHAEHFNELIGEQGPKRGRCRTRAVQDERGHI